MNIDQILAAAAGAGVVIPAIIVVVALVFSRIRFGGYVRRKHKAVWKYLVLEGDRSGVVGGRIMSDATPELAKFRVESREDFGDQELAVRRRQANRLERLCVPAILGGGAWIVIVLIASFVLRAC